MYQNPLSVKKEILVHLVFWIVWSYYTFVSITRTGLRLEIDLNIYEVNGHLLYLLFFYVNYLFVLPKIFTSFRWRKVVFAYLLLLFAFVSIRYISEEILIANLIGHPNYYPGTSPAYYVYDNIFFSSRPMILSTVLWSVVFLVRTLAYNNYVIQEQKNLEIKFLKAQINPHFIFNTLNNIYAMVDAGSPKSLESIEKLSEIMRFTTYEAQKETIALSEEIRYINAYIELEQLRHYEKDFVSWQMSVSDDSRQIPPYLLSPLVENALKHGAFSSSDPIRMQLSDDRQLTFTISNTIADKKKDSLGGIGLENLRNRLEILYPGAYNLETKTEGNRFSAHLQIPL